MAEETKDMSTTRKDSNEPSPVEDTAPSEASAEALMIFSPMWIRHFNDEYRLSTTYAGVRRVRPSSRTVHQALMKSSSTSTTQQSFSEPIAYKVVDPETGQERRMTTQEKRQAKRERQKRFEERKAEAKRKAKEEAATKQAETVSKEEEDVEEEAFAIENDIDDNNNNNNNNNRYVQLKVNPTALEQELADLQGERSGVPPILVSFSQHRAAFRRPLTTLVPQWDEVWTTQWAQALRQSLQPPTHTRQQEAMRDMAYDIIPQPWTRMRPDMLNNVELENSIHKEEPSRGLSSNGNVPQTKDDTAMLPFSMRPPAPRKDVAMEAVVEFLHRRFAGLHVSCGAKFGCDFLLYDGPRHERHAFAGLRIVQVHDETQEAFPLPRAYDLAGYVRCLNTAGKLAMLGTVVPGSGGGDSPIRVAILDLALERIREDKKRKRPTKTLEQRYSNLSKK